MSKSREQLRVAMLAGTLAQGGAEKQLMYMARALRQADVEVRIYSLTRGEFYEPALQTLGMQPIWAGRFSSPMFRLPLLAALLLRFRPHMIQSAHAYTNLYATLLGQLLGAVSIGAMRSNLRHTTTFEAGGWTRWVISTPNALLVNSQKALHELKHCTLVEPKRVFLFSNVIDLSDCWRLDTPTCNAEIMQNPGPKAIFVGRLVSVKRLDRFFQAMVLARRQCPTLKGVIVGDGPERANLEKLTIQMGLGPDTLRFLGQRHDVSALLRQANMLVLCSDDEGFPNVLLEAMAAGLPVITTPAGDASIVVQDRVTGYVVPFDNIKAMADRMVQLAKSPELRRQLGEAGRKRVELHYSYDGLADRLFAIYREIAQQQNHLNFLRSLPA
jgi:glycosyltransferase involved in cell wall biosynthesis